MRARSWVSLVALVSVSVGLACTATSEDSAPAPAPGPADEGGIASEAGTKTPEAGCSPDVSSDPKNCGRCGHDCLGGACTASACRPIRLAVGQADLYDLALDDDYVYFATNQGRDVSRVPKAGGTPMHIATASGFGEILADSVPRLIAVDAKMVYQLDSSRVVATPKNGGTPSAVLTTTDPLVALDVDAAYVYAIGGSGNVYAAALAGGTTHLVGSVQYGDGLGDLVSDGTNLFVAGADGVHAFPRSNMVLDAGGVTGTLVAAHGDPGGIGVTAQSVFLTSRENGSVYSFERSTGKSAIVASGIDFPTYLTLDNSAFYFAAKNAGQVLSCPLSGCPDEPRILAEHQAEPGRVENDATAIYWITMTGGTVMRVAK